MTGPRPHPTPSSQSVMQTLTWMRRQGFRPVPVIRSSKAAVNRDYVDPAYQPPPDDLWLQQNLSVGCVTGPAHGGPLDVDLDCPEAVALAPDFLPPTVTFGRASKPRSHYLYKVDVLAFEKVAFLDPIDRSTIVEIRGDGGHQTVFPGSLHDSGEMVEWNDFNVELRSVAAADLQRRVRQLALAVLVARHVWQDGYHNEPTKHLSGMFAALDWTLDETETFIIALMKFSGDADKSRLPTVRHTFRRFADGKKVTGSGALRKQLKNDALVDRLMELAGSPTVNLVTEYNERFACLMVGNRFRIADLDVPPSTAPEFMAKEDFLNMMATDYTTVDDKPVSKAKLWLSHPRRRTHRRCDFLPGVEDTNKLNLWTGWAVEPSPQGSCSAWLDLLHKVICGGDDDQANWLLHWFANIVRAPLDKPFTAPVIIGRQGVGKSLLVAYFGAILGDNYTVITNEEHIYGRFTGHLSNTLLLHSEEALWGGEKRHRSIIKSLITDATRIFERKGIDAHQVQNYLRLILTSNEQHAAPVETGDRRFTVIDMGARELPLAINEAVLTELRQGGPARLHHYLLNDFNYDPTIPRGTLKNQARSDAARNNWSPFMTWWYNQLKVGQLLPDNLTFCGLPKDNDWPSVVCSTGLFTAMLLSMKGHGERNIPKPEQFGNELKRMLNLVRVKDGTRTIVNPWMPGDQPQEVLQLQGRLRVYTEFPDLKTCRAMFDQLTGEQHDWEEPEPRLPLDRKEHDY